MLDRIYELIKKNGWSISEFERRTGLSLGTFYAWKTGRAAPDKHIAKIVDVLKTSEGYLRGDTDDPNPPHALGDEWELLAAHYDGLDPDIAQKVAIIARRAFAQNATVAKPDPDESVDISGLTPVEIADVRRYIEFLKSKRTPS